MKILLTGAGGFIGSAFARLAVQHGHEVMGLLPPGQPIPADLRVSKQMFWERGTLQEPPWKQIAHFRADACVHMAWITTPGVYLDSPQNYHFVEISQNFLHKVREYGTSYILGLGTCIEYGITMEPLSEILTPIRPSTVYAKCKNELRIALEAETSLSHMSFAWARVFYPYGPGEHPDRLCSSLILKLKRGEKITLTTPASIKDYIYIDDLSAALLKVVEMRICGAINLGTGVGVSVRDIAHRIGKLVGRMDLIEEASVPSLDPFPRVVADAGRIRSLGWSPLVSLEEGLTRLLKQLVFE